MNEVMKRALKAPALFVSHGAPTFALEPGLLGPKLTQLGEQLSSPAAVAVTVCAPAVTPSVQLVVATPDAFETGAAALTEPPPVAIA